MEEVTVVVATFGDLRKWGPLADRAVASLEAQTVRPALVRVHGDSLHGARNEGLAQVTTDTVIFLDADDELEATYVETMLAGTADVRAPAVRYIRGAQAYPPRVPNVAGHGHDCVGDCLEDGNWIIIGAAVRTEILRRAGGWRDFPWSEDWDTWVRCWKAGATFESIPAAIYRAHVRSNSRNREPSKAARLAAHQAIARANGLRVPT